MQIDYVASQRVREVIGSLGRTEDIRFSPNNRRLAVAQLFRNAITVFDIAVTTTRETKNIVISGATELSSAHFNHPHGLDFIDDERLIVANRQGEVCIFELPPSSTAAHEIAPARFIRSAFIKTPGSIAVIHNGRGLCEALVCNNYSHNISKHRLDDDVSISQNEVMLKRWIHFPDGICVSRLGAWIAVSNHETHCVLLYKNDASLCTSSNPVGVLRFKGYPHGLRFTSDDRFILVADAGSPYVNVYGSDQSDWRGVRNPLLLFRVMGDDDFLRGHYNRQEGGPKGVDINNNANILATTCETQPLSFFDLDAILSEASAACVGKNGARGSNFSASPRAHGTREVAYELFRRRMTSAVARLPTRAVRWAYWRAREAGSKLGFGSP